MADFGVYWRLFIRLMNYYTFTKEKTELSIFEDKMKDSIKSLFESILKVDKTYLHYTNEKSKKKKNRQIFEHVERVFAYELYRRWANNKSRPKGTIVNAEISKQLYSEPTDEKIKLTYPDMVLHGGQNSSEHFLICEIKRYENVKADSMAQTEDLNKLGYFLNKELMVTDNIVTWKEYQYGVYILIGYKDNLPDMDSSLDYIKSRIKKTELNVLPEYYKKIICLAYNGDKNNIFYTTLDQLI